MRARMSPGFTVEEARRAGYAAALRGESRSRNPFEPGEQQAQHETWERGWLDREADRESRRAKA